MPQIITRTSEQYQLPRDNGRSRNFKEEKQTCNLISLRIFHFLVGGWRRHNKARSKKEATRAIRLNILEHPSLRQLRKHTLMMGSAKYADSIAKQPEPICRR
jgi:hypothetical protein